jgi:uncharacterized protein YnzC (UPF0291/DUF896 family)
MTNVLNDVHNKTLRGSHGWAIDMLMEKLQKMVKQNVQSKLSNIKAPQKQLNEHTEDFTNTKVKQKKSIKNR